MNIYPHDLPIQVEPSCVWSVPGSNPWVGNDRWLLNKMGLSDDDVNQFFRLRETRGFSHIVTFSSKGIEEDRYPYRSYLKHFKMGFGNNILCNDVVIDPNLEGSYEAKVYYIYPSTYIAVPKICGNLTLIHLDKFKFKPDKDIFFKDIRETDILKIDLPGTQLLFVLGVALSWLKKTFASREWRSPKND